MKPGDLVRFRLAREELEGTLLQSYDSSVVLVKLSSGYNVGIPKEHVLDSEVIQVYSAKTPQPVRAVNAKKLPSLGLVVTGGTIASKLDAKTGAVSAITDVNEFAAFYPALFRMAHIKRIETPFMKLSENMTPDDWGVLAESVKKLLDDTDIEGVIVTHGTDTLHYTSAALSFFLRNLTKPVVLTYSQRSIDRPSSDAELNLRCAARLALSQAAGVFLVGHADLNDDFCYALRGTSARKMHTSRRDAFKAINADAAARVWPDKVEFLGSFRARVEGKTELDSVFSDKIALVTFYPGQDPEILNYYKKEGYKGVILSVLGLGHVAAGSAKTSWIPTIKKLIKEGFVICAVPQTLYGRLNPKVYSTGRELEQAGVIFLENMLAETAFVKLGWVLGHKTWKTKVAEKMLENVAGELNPLLAF